MKQNNLPKLSLFPLTKEINNQNHLIVGGCDTVELAKEYGTPLYIFDEFTIRTKCREFKHQFTKIYPNTLVAYASKAFLNQAIALIIKDEGLGLDVVSGGELSVAQSVSFPQGNIFFHGNNKTEAELIQALDSKIGYIIVDNFYELDLLNQLAQSKSIKQDILLRITPGIDAHTHRYTTTGVLDSKFGFPLISDYADMAVAKAMSASSVNLIGLHFHLGSPVPETTPYELAIDHVLRFAKEMESNYSFHLKKFVIGGGFDVQYTTDHSVLSIANYADVLTKKLLNTISNLDLTAPGLVIEPGRAIIGQAGVALYTVGSIKCIPDKRTYVCVDGGMGDNIRPALYQSEYEALLANKIGEAELASVSIAGKFCESGDILVKDTKLATALPGDLIAIPVSGAYCIPMSNNYNMITRPSIVMVNNGESRLIRKRETYQDLIRLDLI